MKKGSVIYKATALLCMSALLFTGCSSEEDETHSIAIVRESMENEYDLTKCEKRDVIKTESISCTYSQLLEENLAFPTGEKTVAFVYVNEGDEVIKPQLENYKWPKKIQRIAAIPKTSSGKIQRLQLKVNS